MFYCMEKMQKKLENKILNITKKLNEIQSQLVEESNDILGENLVVIRSLIIEKEMLEKELNKVKKALESLKLSKSQTSYVVEIDKHKKKFYIVDSHFADPTIGYISNQSPLAKALVRGRISDEVTYLTPKGEKRCKILSVI